MPPLLKSLLLILIFTFVLMNVVAAIHAYKFTHFIPSKTAKTNEPDKLTTREKIATLIFGISNPRPFNDLLPATDYKTLILNSNKKIECWQMKVANPKGSVILFHGFSGQKASLLEQAAIFRENGYNTLLVDFMGSGGSEGNQTTIGFKEAEQVKTCVDYLKEKGEHTLFLYGTSMGAVAIMKALSKYNLQPKGIIIECPFGSMYKTVCARFNTMKAPSFPMAWLLVVWGGIQNGFWALAHNPTEYAKDISCPTLLMYGQQDTKVSRQEIDEIFTNLNGPKFLKIYHNAGHENYLTRYKNEWTKDITDFLNHAATK